MELHSQIPVIDQKVIGKTCEYDISCRQSRWHTLLSSSSSSSSSYSSSSSSSSSSNIKTLYGGQFGAAPHHHHHHHHHRHHNVQTLYSRGGSTTPLPRLVQHSWGCSSVHEVVTTLNKMPFRICHIKCHQECYEEMPSEMPSWMPSGMPWGLPYEERSYLLPHDKCTVLRNWTYDISDISIWYWYDDTYVKMYLLILLPAASWQVCSTLCLSCTPPCVRPRVRMCVAQRRQTAKKSTKWRHILRTVLVWWQLV